MNEPSSEYVILGLNHKTAPIEIRERLSFSHENLDKVLKQVASLPSIEECFILSTCNRVEIHAASLSPGAALSEMRRFLMKRSGLNGELTPHLYAHSGLQAVHHLFRVTASLDSMIIGEAQITGQVKTAFGLAHEMGCARLFLQRLLNKALTVAKRIRTDTVISSGSVSFGSVAVDLITKIFGDLREKKIAMVGAGKIGAVVINALSRKGVLGLVILNRTVDKAAALAGSAALAGKFRALELTDQNLNTSLIAADVAIFSIDGAPLFTATRVADLMHQRRNKPLLLIDLGLPRNIENGAEKLANVYLYNVDDLKGIAEANLSSRQSEANKAEAIVLTQAENFFFRLGKFPLYVQALN